MKAKYPNQRWLTVRNDNPLTVNDYSVLCKMKKNAIRLYEEICLADVRYNERFAFSSSDYSEKTGIDESDIRKAWKQLEDNGFIHKYPNSTNEYWIQINSSIKEELEKKSPSNIIKSSFVYKLHTKVLCMFSEMTDSMKIIMTELMKGNEYSPKMLSERYSMTERTIKNGMRSLIDEGYIFKIDDSDEYWHVCSVPYFECPKPRKLNMSDEDWIKFDKVWHCKWCSDPKNDSPMFTE